ELGGLPDGEVCWFGTLENFVDVSRGAPEQGNVARAVRQKPASFHPLRREIYGGKSGLCRQIDDLPSETKGGDARQYQHRVGPQFPGSLKARLDVLGLDHVKVVKLDLDRPCGKFHLLQRLLGTGVDRASQNGHAREPRNDLLQQLELLGAQAWRQAAQ